MGMGLIRAAKSGRIFAFGRVWTIAYMLIAGAAIAARNIMIMRRQLINCQSRGPDSAGQAKAGRQKQGYKP